MENFYEVKLFENYIDEGFVEKTTKYCKNNNELEKLLRYFFWDSELYPKVETTIGSNKKTIYMESYTYYDVVYGSYVELLAVLIPITKFKYRKKHNRYRA